jgi:hypothetical protein
LPLKSLTDRLFFNHASVLRITELPLKPEKILAALQGTGEEKEVENY